MAKLLLTTRRFTVEQRVFDGPLGEPIVREAVVHPGAAVILPILDASRIIMIRQIRQVVDEELWELPAGTLEPGEPPIETACRELIEETGYRAERIEPLVTFYSSPGICTELMHVFVATGLTPVGQNLDAGEQIDVEIVSLIDARRRLLAGELRDGKTIAALGRYLLGNDAERVS